MKLNRYSFRRVLSVFLILMLYFSSLNHIKAYNNEENKAYSAPLAVVQQKPFSQTKSFTVSGTDENGFNDVVNVEVTVSGQYTHINGTNINNVSYDVIHSVSGIDAAYFHSYVTKSYKINTSSVTITVKFYYSFGNGYSYKTLKYEV